MNLLFEFITVNEIEKLQILVKLIEDLDKQDIIRHFTPLHIAAKNGSIEAFILVMDHLNDINPECIGSQFEYEGRVGMSPIHYGTEHLKIFFRELYTISLHLSRLPAIISNARYIIRWDTGDEKTPDWHIL